MVKQSQRLETEYDTNSKKVRMLKLYSGEEPILVRDFGSIKYWTTREHHLNIKALQDKPYMEIERLFRKGLIPLKSFDETIKTIHGTSINRRWYQSKVIKDHNLDFINPASLNYIASTVLLLFTFALIFLRGFDSLTGSFIISEFFYTIDPRIMILLYLSVAYFVVSTILLQKHNHKTRIKTKYLARS